MAKACRLMSWIAVICLPGLFLILSIPSLYAVLRAHAPVSVLLDVAGVAVAFSAVAPWPLAVGHWRRRYPPHPQWVLWGFALFFGLVVGGWCYWLIATRHSEAVDTDVGLGAGKGVIGA
jgi:type VI protein secretion system component VasK